MKVTVMFKPQRALVLWPYVESWWTLVDYDRFKGLYTHRLIVKKVPIAQLEVMIREIRSINEKWTVILCVWSDEMNTEYFQKIENMICS